MEVAQTFNAGWKLNQNDEGEFLWKFYFWPKFPVICVWALSESEKHDEETNIL